MIFDGVLEEIDANGEVTGYRENDVITSARDYYSTFTMWSGASIKNAVDAKFKNDYIKLRELAITYRLPKSILNKIFLRSCSVTLFGRDIGYLYKSLPNMDAEAYSGAGSFTDGGLLPATQSFGFQVNLGL